MERLRERGYFDIDEDQRREIGAYKRQNNNVLIFIEEKCELFPDLSVGKDELYRAYVDWCERSGCKPLNKINFGKELKKQFQDVKEARTSSERSWDGIGCRQTASCTYESSDKNDEDIIPF